MSGDGVRGRRPRGQESRQAFLEAGMALLRTQTLADAMGSVSTRQLAATAHRTTGAFYHHWECTDDYLRDLLLYVFEPGSIPYLEEVASLLDRLASDKVDQITFIRELCCYDLGETASDPKFAAEMVLWSKYDDERVRSSLHRFYAHADDIASSRFVALAQGWQREFRPPFDEKSASVVMSALLAGLAVRRLIDPKQVPDTLLGDVVLALIPGMTRTIGDADDLDHWVAWLNDADGTAAFTNDVDESSESVRQRILTAAAALLRTRGHGVPAVGEVARAAGVSVPTVRQHFPTTAILIEHLISIPLAEINQAEAQAVAREPRSLGDVLLRRLTGLARVVIAERATARAFLDTVLENTPSSGSLSMQQSGRHVTLPSDLLRPVLEFGQQIGVIREDLSAADLAETMSTLVLLRTLSHPTLTAEAVGATVAKLTLEGALNHPDGLAR